MLKNTFPNNMLSSFSDFLAYINDSSNSSTQYSYLILKPDSGNKISEILSMIEENFSLSELSFFVVENWKNAALSLYEDHFNWNEFFYHSLFTYLTSVEELFGSKALLVLIHSDRYTKEELINEIYALKKKIRKMRNNLFSLIVDAAQIPEFKDLNFPMRQVTITGENGIAISPFCLSENGYFDFHALNLCHCPDPDINTTIEELRLLTKLNVISPDTMVTDESLTLLTIYHTMQVLKCRKDTN